RYGGEFIEEDVRLLERLSRNAAAVIANAQIFQEVVEEKQKLVHTLESLTAGLILINQHGRIGQINAQAPAMFGVDESVLGKPYAEVMRHEQWVEILRRKINEAENPPVSEEEQEEAELRRPDEITVSDEQGEDYIYQVHAASVHDDANKPLG